MYRTLLSDYDSRQKDLLLENAELKKVLQQMKRDMMTILRSKKPTPKRETHEDCAGQVGHVSFHPPPAFFSFNYSTFHSLPIVFYDRYLVFSVIYISFCCLIFRGIAAT